MMDETIGAACAKALFELAVERGADRATLIERTGLDALGLREPDARLPLESYVRLMAVAKELCGDPALALRFGEAFDAAELSIVASLAHNQEAAGALAELNRFSPLAIDVDTGGKPRMEPVRRAGKMWLVDHRTNPNRFPELTESSFARIVCQARKFEFAAIRQVHFSHAEPSYRSEYDRVFRIPMTFGCEWNAFEIDPAMMTLKFAPQPEYVRDVLVERADRLLADLQRSRTVRGKVERLVSKRLGGGRTDVVAIAAELGLSRQTLHRRLRNENTTFSEVVDALRCNLAHHYLEGAVRTSEIAERLGFADRAGFSRAFKRWTGHAPRDVGL